MWNALGQSARTN